MSTPPAGSTTVSLDIGGLGIDLVCNDPSLAEHLSSRYHSFPPTSRLRFRALIQNEPGGVSNSLLQLPLRFLHGALVYDAPGFQGYVDPAAGHAGLILRCLQPEVQLDYFLRTICALLAFEAGGAMFHAAAILHGGQAYAFFGPSGSGKSTVARLSAPEVVLNDDLVLLMPGGGGWQVHATPFWNYFQGQSPAAPARLVGLFRLVQDRQVFLEQIDTAHAVAEMIASLPVVSADRSRGVQLIQRCQAILEQVAAYRLHFLPDASFWPLVERALGAKIEPG